MANLYAIEAEILGHPAEHRKQARQERSRPMVEVLQAWLQAQLLHVPGASDLEKAMRYAIRYWPGLIAFLEDGRIDTRTNVVERAIRPITLDRKCLICWFGWQGSSLGDCNDVDPADQEERRGPMSCLPHVLKRIVCGRTKSNELQTLLPRDGQPMDNTAPHLRQAALAVL